MTRRAGRSRRAPGGVALAVGVLALALTPIAPAGAAGVASINDVIMGSEPVGGVVVVDDDRAQCPDAVATTIQGGVDLAHDGDVVHVCPGRYQERVVVAASVRIEGTPDAVTALDCLDPAQSAGDLDPDRFAVLHTPSDGEGTLLRLEADGIRVSGLVVEGLHDDTVETPAPGVGLYDAAITAPHGWAGGRIDRNLLRDNTLGVELGSSGSRVDRNCFRGNGWDLSNQRYPLDGARIDDNTTVDTRTIAWELGWAYAPVTQVRLDHNTSIALGFAVVYTAYGSGVTIEGNVLRATQQGVYVGPGGAAVRVAGNVVTGATPTTGAAGIAVASPGAEAPVVGLVIDGNRVSDMRGPQGRGILLQPNAQPRGAVVTENVVARNAEGLALGAGNNVVRLANNTATDNSANGIRLSAGTLGNRLTDNVALGNATDARDGSLPTTGATPTSNRWIRTTCVTDVPVGAICVPPAGPVSP